MEEKPTQVEETPIANINIEPIVDSKIATPPVVPEPIEQEIVPEQETVVESVGPADSVLNEVAEKLQSEIIPDEVVPEVETEPEIQAPEPIPEPEIEQTEEVSVQTEEVAETQSTTISEVNTFEPIEAPTFTEPKLEDITPKPMPIVEVRCMFPMHVLQT